MILRSLLILAAATLLVSCFGSPAGLLRPNGVALAPDGSLFVMDRGHNRIAHLSETGQLLNSIGRLGTDPGDIYSGWDIALDAAGNIYICYQTLDEVGSSRSSDGVKVFSADGRFLRDIGQQNYTHQIVANTPYGLDIDSQGRVYLADFGTNAIRIFTAQGEQLARFSGQDGDKTARFHTPVDVAIDNQRNLIYLADPLNSQIQQFNLTTTPSGQPTLTHHLSFGEYGRQPGQLAYPQNIVVNNRSGWVYVSDMGNRRIQVFDNQGQYLNQFVPPSDWQVLGIDVGSDGVVYAADALNNVIWVFEPDGRVRRRIEVTS